MKTKKIFGILAILFFVFLLIRTYFNLYFVPTAKVVKPRVDFNDSLVLEVTDSIFFQLDSVTSPGVVWDVQYAEIEHGKYVAFLNIVSGRIYFYDLNEKKLTRTIPLDSLGYTPNDGVQGFCVLSRDSILVYSYKKSRWSIISETAGKIAQGDFDKGGNSFLNVYPFVTTGSPAIYDGASTQAYFVGFSSPLGDYDKDRQRNVLTRLDLSTGRVNNDVKYPEFYWGVNWGGVSGFEGLSYCFNPSEGSLIFNFMADNDLTVFDTRSHRSRKVYAGSRYFTELRSLKFHPILIDLYKDEIIRHYHDNFAYLVIVYDRFRKMYYRITDFPSGAQGKTHGGRPQKQNSILLLDSALNRVGEVVLPVGKYNINNFFVSEAGFCLKRDDTGNDELLIYDCFNPKLNKR